MNTLKLSAHSLEIAACPARYRYYRIVGRRLAFPGTARVAGAAIHAALHAYHTGKDVAIQEAAIDAILTKTPPQLDDYRHAAYLKDCVAQYRAEYPAQRWPVIEESEREFDRKLGVVCETEVRWTGRRDLVVVGHDGLRYVVDWKTASRDRALDWKLMNNSDQPLGYAWAYQDEFPDRQVHGFQLVRIVMRPPTAKGKGVLYDFPKDAPIMLAKTQIEEWRRDTLAWAASVARRDPAKPEDWPMNRALCGNRFSKACDYLETCCLPATQRDLHLSTDLYESSERKPDESTGD